MSQATLRAATSQVACQRSAMECCWLCGACMSSKQCSTDSPHLSAFCASSQDGGMVPSVLRDSALPDGGFSSWGRLQSMPFSATLRAGPPLSHTRWTSQPQMAVQRHSLPPSTCTGCCMALRPACQHMCCRRPRWMCSTTPSMATSARCEHTCRGQESIGNC